MPKLSGEIATEGRFASVYSPAPLVTVSYRKFVPVLTAATFASGMVAFDGSITRPVMEPFVVCARSAQGYGDKRRTSRRAGTLYIKLIWSRTSLPSSCHRNPVSATITDLCSASGRSLLPEKQVAL